MLTATGMNNLLAKIGRSRMGGIHYAGNIYRSEAEDRLAEVLRQLEEVREEIHEERLARVQLALLVNEHESRRLVNRLRRFWKWFCEIFSEVF